MGHDLRNPLAAIGLSAALLRKSAEPRDVPVGFPRDSLQPNGLELRFFLLEGLPSLVLFELGDVAIFGLTVQLLADVLFETGVLIFYFFVLVVDGAVLLVLELDEALLEFFSGFELPLDELGVGADDVLNLLL